MGLASIFETFNIVCNCFFPNKVKKYDHIQKNLEDKHIENISIIPANNTFQIKNLYPSANNTEKWSMLVIGSDLTYIKVCLGDFNFPNMDTLTNKKGVNVISKQLNDVLEPIWISTLKGNKLQFFFNVDNHLYFVNTYPLQNELNNVVAAVMFIRNFTSEKRDSFDTITAPSRLSFEQK